jgi:hypothetical protein
VDLVHWETAHPLTGGKNPCRRHLYRAEIQEEKKRREKQENIEN